MLTSLTLGGNPTVPRSTGRRDDGSEKRCDSILSAASPQFSLAQNPVTERDVGVDRCRWCSLKADRGNSCVGGDAAVHEFGARVPGNVSAIVIEPFRNRCRAHHRGTILVVSLHMI